MASAKRMPKVYVQSIYYNLTKVATTSCCSIHYCGFKLPPYI